MNQYNKKLDETEISHLVDLLLGITPFTNDETNFDEPCPKCHHYYREYRIH